MDQPAVGAAEIAPATSPHRTAVRDDSPRARRVRALGWALALEAALVASLLTALRGHSWLALPLTVLQVPGWLVAAACLFPFNRASGPSDTLFTTIMFVVNVPAIYLLIRACDPGQARSSRCAESLSRPYPNAIPVLALAALVPMYMAIAVWTPGRTLFMPELALDRAVPLQPAWALVYGSQWVFSFLPVFVVRGVELRRRTVLAYLSIVITAYVGFLIYPTVAPRPADVAGDGIFAHGLRTVYDLDPPYNCFPSLHVAYSFLAALTSYRVHRGLGLAALVWAALIGISTLYTKQHYVVDVIAGVLMAYAAYAVFLRGFSRQMLSHEDQRLAPMRALAVPGIYAVVVACFWLAYQTR